MAGEENETTPSGSEISGLAFKVKPFTTQAFKRFKNSQIIIVVTLIVGMIGTECIGWTRPSYVFGIPCACSMVLAFGFGQYTYRRPSQFGYIGTGILSFIAACLCVPTILHYASDLDRGYGFYSLGVVGFGVAIILSCLAQFVIIVSWILAFFRISGFNASPKCAEGLGQTLNEVLEASNEGLRITIESGNCVGNADDDMKKKETPPSYEC